MVINYIILWQESRCTIFVTDAPWWLMSLGIRRCQNKWFSSEDSSQTSKYSTPLNPHSFLMWLRFSCFILQQCQCGHQFKFSTCKMSGGLVKHCPFPVHCGITCVKRCLCTPTVNGLLKGKSLLPQEASNYNRLSGILPLSANEVTGFLVLYSSDTLASCYCTR
jgi:hypothetical protein